ncbi:PstS family phosphate ABC transporter substrate-binding protein [Halovivax sp.]|uniref:PstS family phosphate ABC transporter substrate-binding protein n=1 Tax=Halovivax sp. TaxID=1935978 RepID=UPI0025BC0CD8|nr:PstS family phosphate ABC transporter substrate-binding protein [Halovivax sp.]
MEGPRRSERGAGVARRSLLAAAGGSVAALAGCLVHGEDSGLEGEIRVDGSNTVLPHSASVAEEFAWRNNRVEVPVRGSGTGAGFQLFCTGSTEVQNASRTIKDDEADLCEDNGIEHVELEVALDGLAIYANPSNDWCDCLTVDELRRIWEPGSAVETWSDVRSEWPDEAFDLYGRDPASGTFDYFTETINGEVGAIRSDYSPSADTNVIIRGVRGDRHALGFGGAGYFYENEDDLKLIGVDDGGGCEVPTLESVESEEYQPLTRPLYAYVRTDALAREEVRAFARFYYEEIDDQARQADVVDDDEPLTWGQWSARMVRFFGLSDERVAANAEKLESAIDEVVG